MKKLLAMILSLAMTATLTAADGFTFDMEKWRSSLGAYGVEDCQVTFDNDGNFTLTTGDEWIS